MTDACPNCGATGMMWEPATRTCHVCWNVRLITDDAGRILRVDRDAGRRENSEARERRIERIADLIDPPAFAILSPWDKPVDERARIEERQIVARKRAERILDYLEGERN